jgi:hypothetical protein
LKEKTFEISQIYSVFSLLTEFDQYKFLVFKYDPLKIQNIKQKNWQIVFCPLSTNKNECKIIMISRIIKQNLQLLRLFATLSNGLLLGFSQFFSN